MADFLISFSRAKGAAGALGLAALAMVGAAQAEPIRGAGSTFAAPVLSQWSRDYEAARADGGDYVSPDWRVDFEPMGSLSGVMSLARPEMDFAATDAPFPAEELKARGWTQFPVVMGGVAVVAKVEGFAPGELRLSGPVIAEIYLGHVTNWSDPAIAALNPGRALPDAEIAPLYRVDGSGTTLAFTNFLAETSPQWRAALGADTLVAWPVGRGEKGTGRLAALAGSTANSLAYLEYGQALRSGLAFAAIENQNGEFVKPEPEAFAKGLEAVDWDAAKGFVADVANLPGAGAYPIAVATYAVIPHDRGAARAKRVMDLFRLAFSAQGSAQAAALGYIPAPPRLVGLIEADWAKSFAPASN